MGNRVAPRKIRSRTVVPMSVPANIGRTRTICKAAIMKDRTNGHKKRRGEGSAPESAIHRVAVAMDLTGRLPVLLETLLLRRSSGVRETGSGSGADRPERCNGAILAAPRQGAAIARCRLEAGESPVRRLTQCRIDLLQTPVCVCALRKREACEAE